MSSRRSGLGKGLSSLIPSEIADVSDGPYCEIAVNSIVPNPRQPRRQFDEESLAALSSSVAEVGVIQPIIVRSADHGAYEIIAGERRWRAAKRAGRQTIPALVREADAKGSLETAIVENFHRQDLNPLEEAAAYSQLIEDFGLSQTEVAKRVGRSRSAVANTIRLMQLPPSVQRLLIDGHLSAGHGRALLAVQDEKAQQAMAKKAADEALTVRQVELLLRGESAADEDLSDYLAKSQTSPVPRQTARRGHGLPSSGAPQQAGILELQELLSARFDTTVKILMGKGTGRLVVDFADLDDLERIYRIITPHRKTLK